MIYLHNELRCTCVNHVNISLKINSIHLHYKIHEKCSYQMNYIAIYQKHLHVIMHLKKYMYVKVFVSIIQ